jgi:hypothetical protein
MREAMPGVDPKRDGVRATSAEVTGRRWVGLAGPLERGDPSCHGDRIAAGQIAVCREPRMLGQMLTPAEDANS